MIAAVLVTVSVGPAGDAVAQESPLEPTGRAVCNIAFTLAGAVGLGSFVVPPDAPLGPSEVIVALRPILDACVDVFPPAPPRQCFTADLYPNTGLPITLPDPVGILTEQVEAATNLLLPLGIDLSGPLHDVFVSALRCRDVAAIPDDGDAPTGLIVEEPAPSARTPDAGPPPDVAATVPASSGERGAAVALAPVRSVPPVAEPSTALLSAVPEPLRGAAVAAAAAFVAACAFAFRRLLSPRRPASLLDPDGRVRR